MNQKKKKKKKKKKKTRVTEIDTGGIRTGNTVYICKKKKGQSVMANPWRHGKRQHDACTPTRHVVLSAFCFLLSAF